MTLFDVPEPVHRSWWQRQWDKLRRWWFGFRIRRGWVKVRFPICNRGVGLSIDDIVSAQPMILTQGEKKKLLLEFAMWLEKCSGNPVLVRVQGVEGGKLFDREVSITDAVTDFSGSTKWSEDDPNPR